MASFSGAGLGVLLTITNLSLHPVDILILGTFLVATLVVGLTYGRQVKTIHDYALGGQNFSTHTLVATIVATFASGSGFFINIENTYTNGLVFMLPFLGVPLQLWLQGRLAMRMGEFMNHVSIAEAMGSMYGQSVQIITAISSILARVGYMAIQFKIIAKVIVILFAIDSELATIIATSIVVIYSAFGGIKAVTFTDVLQFFTFWTLLPVLALVIWRGMQHPSEAMSTLASNPVFNLQQISSYNVSSLSILGLFLYYAMPTMQPELFQRMAMAGDVRKARRVLTYAAGGLLLVYLISWWIGMLLLADHPGLAKEKVIAHMISRYTSPGMLGLLGAGIIAMAMSTADSSLNAISVMFAHDLVKPLTGQKEGSVTHARLFSVAAGFFALFMALYNQDLLSLVLLSVSFYKPIFVIPFLLAVLGFRTSTRAVLLSMVAGALTVVVCQIFFPTLHGVFPALIVNVLVLLGGHYLLGEPGGWQQIDPDSPLGLERAARREAWKKRKEIIKNFSLYRHLEQLIPPKEGSFTLFGIYALMATFVGLFTIGRAEMKAYDSLYTGISVVLWLPSVFITYPIWPPYLKGKRFMAFFWPLGISTILLFAGSLLAIVSHFHAVQVFVLVANFLLIASLLRWPTALFLASVSISSAALFFVHYTGHPLPWEAIGPIQFRLLYGALIFSGLLLVFFNDQEGFKRLSKSNEALQYREKDQQESLVQAAAEKQAALAALQYTGADKLLSITRELATLPIKDEGKQQLEALQTELLPIAFHLQNFNTRAQHYLRLQKTDLLLSGWCSQVKAAAVEQGVTARIYCANKSSHEQINCDTTQLTSMVVSSMVLLNQHVASQEDTPPILFRIEDTQLSYPMPDVKPGYIKHVPAVRIAITVSDDLPTVQDSYTPQLDGASTATPKTVEDLAKLTSSRIVKAHYGYEEVTADTYSYVVPVDVEDVRPKDMDRDYMEVGAMPKHANDHFVGKGIDAQAQEAAFLKDVAARSNADLYKVKAALKAIKWYHGHKDRNSGEPFYLHPLTVAHIVMDYNTDEKTIIGALLHDTVEDTSMQLEQIEDRFSQEIAEVVNLVTHLQSTPNSIYKVKMSASENLQMLERTGNKLGLYVKIADRMHNMRTINGHGKVSKRKLIAQETADFFVPLARKLGLEAAAQEFEKMCLEVLRQKD